MTQDSITCGEYKIPECCENCGSKNIIMRVIYDGGITRYVCLDCGNSRSLPKQKNLNRRYNTTINNWAWRIKRFRPYCYICGSKENLEAHHIIPVNNSKKYMYLDTNGITLCKKCHRLVHKKGGDSE